MACSYLFCVVTKLKVYDCKFFVCLVLKNTKEGMHGISKALSTYLVNVKSCDYLVKSDVEIVQEIYNLHSKEDMVDDKLHYYMARRAWGNLGVLVGCY